MKKMNKTGFTLIELLAVIIILAILIAVAVPAVNRYLDNARKETYVENIKLALKAVKMDASSGFANASAVDKEWNNDTIYIYDIDALNRLLDKKLVKSPFGKKYQKKSAIYVRIGSNMPIRVCFMDEGGNGVNELSEETGVDPNNPDSISDKRYTIYSWNVGGYQSGISEYNIKSDVVLKGFTRANC